MYRNVGFYHSLIANRLLNCMCNTKYFLSIRTLICSHCFYVGSLSVTLLELPLRPASLCCWYCNIYTLASNTIALELSLTQDLQILSTSFPSNYLTINPVLKPWFWYISTAILPSVLTILPSKYKALRRYLVSTLTISSPPKLTYQPRSRPKSEFWGD